MTEVKFLPLTVSPALKAYLDIVEDSRKQMEEAVGIPADRLGFSKDPINRDVSKAAFKAMVQDTIVMTRTWFDKVTTLLVTANIRSQKTTRVPRKLKKRVKNKYKLGITTRANLTFNLEVYKMAKYYRCKVKREKNG